MRMSSAVSGDLQKYPELVWINRLYFVPNFLLLYGLYCVGGLGLMTYAGTTLNPSHLAHGVFGNGAFPHLWRPTIRYSRL